MNETWTNEHERTQRSFTNEPNMYSIRFVHVEIRSWTILSIFVLSFLGFAFPRFSFVLVHLWTNECSFVRPGLLKLKIENLKYNNLILYGFEILLSWSILQSFLEQRRDLEGAEEDLFRRRSCWWRKDFCDMNPLLSHIHKQNPLARQEPNIHKQNPLARQEPNIHKQNPLARQEPNIHKQNPLSRQEPNIHKQNPLARQEANIHKENPLSRQEAKSHASRIYITSHMTDYCTLCGFHEVLSNTL